MGETVIQMDEQTWRIEDDGVRFFLLTGLQRGLVIDTGMTTKNARAIAESLTDLPLLLINTHADIDHIAGNDAFETALMHPAEYGNYLRKDSAHPTPTAVWDGDVIDPGGRPLMVIQQPGHTPGSIALLDITRRVLYSADSIQDDSIFLFGPMRNRIAYRQSLHRIWEYRGRFDEIRPSHGTLPLSPDVILDLMGEMDRILSGQEPYEREEKFGLPVRVYRTESADFFLDEE